MNCDTENEKPVKKMCKYCQKPLKAIGSSRKNGKYHKDWKTRDSHKKCWYENL